MPAAAPQPDVSPATAYVALGSNLGDRRRHLQAALQALNTMEAVEVSRASSFHDTAPVGPQDQRRFLNAVAEVHTTLPPHVLMDGLLEIEASLGRRPREHRQHWGPREIDLDLLMYGDTVVDTPGLTLPHPRMHERGFVLGPLCEIAPQLRHPVSGRTVADLSAAAACGLAEATP